MCLSVGLSVFVCVWFWILIPVWEVAYDNDTLQLCEAGERRTFPRLHGQQGGHPLVYWDGKVQLCVFVHVSLLLCVCLWFYLVFVFKKETDEYERTSVFLDYFVEFIWMWWQFVKFIFFPVCSTSVCATSVSLQTCPLWSNWYSFQICISNTFVSQSRHTNNLLSFFATFWDFPVKTVKIKHISEAKINSEFRFTQVVFFYLKKFIL